MPEPATLRRNASRVLDMKMSIGWSIMAYLVMLTVTWASFAVHDVTENTEQSSYTTEMTEYISCSSEVNRGNDIRDVLLFVAIEGEGIGDGARKHLLDYVESDWPFRSVIAECGPRPLPPG